MTGGITAKAHAGLRLIMGPTSSGKTTRSVQLAQESGAPVIVVDRVQVYDDLAATSGRPSADEIEGTTRVYLDHRVTTSWPTEMSAAEGLSRLRRLIADARPGAILEGGSTSMWKSFFAERNAPQLVSEIIVRRVADWQWFAREVEQRISGLLGTMLDELAATLSDPRTRAIVLGMVGPGEVHEWSARQGIALKELGQIKNDVAMCLSLAKHMTPGWVAYAQMQQAVFERLLAGYDYTVELVGGSIGDNVRENVRDDAEDTR